MHRMALVGLAASLGGVGCFGESPSVPEDTEGSSSTGDGGSTTGPGPVASSDETGTGSTGSTGSTGADDTTTATTASTSTGDDTTGEPAECGNGVAEADEACDGVDWQGETCETLGYLPGRLACTKACEFDVTGCTPPDMALVPGGAFEMGSLASPDEQPIRTVELSPFYVDLRETTVAEFGDCVAAGACDAITVEPGCNYGVAGREDHPVNCVDWADADAYCTWAGGGAKRLPTEAEWEKAARGTDVRTFPWGNAPLPNCDYVIMDDGGLGCGQDSTWVVGSRPMGASAYGALDMAGNVWEWVSDWHAPYDPGATVDPVGPVAGVMRVLRGGGWYHASAGAFTTTHRHPVAADLADAHIGIRCAQSLP